MNNLLRYEFPLILIALQGCGSDSGFISAETDTEASTATENGTGTTADGPSSSGGQAEGGGTATTTGSTSGGTDGGDTEGSTGPSGATTEDTTSSDTGASESSGAGDTGAADAGNCDTDVAELTICSRSTTVSAGEIAEVEIHVLRPDDCTADIDGFGGPLVLDDTHFVVQNPVTRPEAMAGMNNCIEQMSEIGFDVVYMWMWSLSLEGNANCPGPFPPGLITTLEIAVDPATPPGDYTLGFPASARACAVDANGLVDGHCGAAGQIEGVLTVE